MRVKRMRWDMAVCLMLMSLTVLGIIKLNDKTEFLNKALDRMEPYLNQVTEVPDGEIGGYATEDLPRLETEEELRESDGYFTMEMTAVHLYNMGTVMGKENCWNVVKLDSGSLVAIKLNKNKLQEVKDGSRDKLILPTGVCVHEDSEAYALMRKWNGNYEVVDDFYIDMDGMADYSTTVLSNKMMGILMVIECIMPIVAFAGMIGTIFFYHWIGVKIGIFPPIFNRKK